MAPSERRVALVTGGSGALGGAVARTLGRAGFDVAIQYQSSEAAAMAVADAVGESAITVRADVSSWDHVRAMEEEVRARLGAASVLVNCAGVRHDGLLAGQGAAEWRHVIDVNLLGTFHAIRAVLPNMLRARFGRVVNVVSPAGLVGSAGQTAYSASKAGVVGLTRSLALECGRRGVTVNALSPGFMESAMTAGLDDKARSALLARVAIPRMTTGEEVAEAVTFIIENDYMTGQVVSVDGGLSA